MQVKEAQYKFNQIRLHFFTKTSSYTSHRYESAYFLFFRILFKQIRISDMH